MRTVNELIEQLQEIKKNGYGESLVYYKSDYISTLSGFDYKDLKMPSGHIETVVVFHVDEQEWLHG